MVLSFQLVLQFQLRSFIKGMLISLFPPSINAFYRCRIAVDKEKSDFAFTNKPNLKKELLSYMKGERVLNGRGKGLAI